MPTAIVLSGGGAKGDFQIGALRALFNRGIQPDIVCGTSVGSINGATIAQGQGGLEELEGIWMSLQQNRDMFNEDPVYASIPGRIKDFFLFEGARAAFDVVGLVVPFAFLVDLALFGIEVKDAQDAIDQLKSLKSIYNLDPIRQKLTFSLSADKVAHSGIKLRLAMVSLESGKLRFVDESGQFTDDRTQVNLMDAVIASSSIPFIFPPQQLGSENFVDGGIRDITPIQAALDAGADRVFAVVASRAGTDPKPSFDTANFIAIGQRAAEEIMPDQLQTDGTNPPRGWGSDVTIIQPETDVHDSFVIEPGLIRIARDYGHMRTTEIIDASPSGLGGIFRFLALSQLSRQITEIRKVIWEEESWANGHPPWPAAVIDPNIVPSLDSDALGRVRKMKRQLKDLLEQRQRDFGLTPRIAVGPAILDFGQVVVPGRKSLAVFVENCDDGVYSGTDSLWKQWESHRWTPAVDTPWDLFVTKGGTLAAETPPDASVFAEDLQITVASGDPEFEPQNSLTVKGGQPGTLTVTFVPSSNTTVETALTISSNDPNNPVTVIQLKGSGVMLSPTLVVSPNHIAFGSVSIDGNTVTRAVTLSNEGSSGLQLELSIAQAGPLDVFDIDEATGSPFPLAVGTGQSTTIHLSFTPASVQAFSGSLAISSNDPARPDVRLPLSGTGIGGRH